MRARRTGSVGGLTSILLGKQATSVWVPPDVSVAAATPPYAGALAAMAERLRPEQLLEVGSEFGLVGIAAAQAGWAREVHWVMRDVIGARVVRETLAARPVASAAVALGEGPLDAPAATYDAIVVHQQPSRALTELFLRQAAARLAPGGTMLLAGPVRKGVRVAAKVLEDICEEVRREAVVQGAWVLSGRGVRPERGVDAPPPREEHADEIAGVAFRWLSSPGVFSADAVDPASALLLETIRLPHRGRLLDLGCGAGVLGLWSALRMPDLDVTMVDSDVAAVHCADAGIRLNGLANARAILSDGIDALSGERFDVVVMNPPVHRAGRSDAGLAQQFVRQAAHGIGRKGRLWLVAAPTVPVRGVLDELFTEVAVAEDDGRFRVYDAIRRPSRREERQAAADG